MVFLPSLGCSSRTQNPLYGHKSDRSAHVTVGISISAYRWSVNLTMPTSPMWNPEMQVDNRFTLTDYTTEHDQPVAGPSSRTLDYGDYVDLKPLPPAQLSSPTSASSRTRHETGLPITELRLHQSHDVRSSRTNGFRLITQTPISPSATEASFLPSQSISPLGSLPRSFESPYIQESADTESIKEKDVVFDTPSHPPEVSSSTGSGIRSVCPLLPRIYRRTEQI